MNRFLSLIVIAFVCRLGDDRCLTYHGPDNEASMVVDHNEQD